MDSKRRLKCQNTQSQILTCSKPYSIINFKDNSRQNSQNKMIKKQHLINRMVFLENKKSKSAQQRILCKKNSPPQFSFLDDEILDQIKQDVTSNKVINKQKMKIQVEAISQTETIVPPKRSRKVQYKQLPQITIKTYKVENIGGKNFFITKTTQKNKNLDDQNDKHFESFQQAFPDLEKSQSEIMSSFNIDLQQKKRLEYGRRQRQRNKQTKQMDMRLKSAVLDTIKNAELIKVKSESTIKSLEINRSNIAKLFSVGNFKELLSKEYVQSENEDSFFFETFKYLVGKIKAIFVVPGHELNKLKITTFIIRRILDDYVDETLKLPHRKRTFYNTTRRITNQDRKNYLSLNLEPPTNRVERHQLKDFFNNVDFKEYYIRYVTSDRLRKYLMNIHQDHVVQYQLAIQQIQAKKESIENKLKELRGVSLKPFLFAHVVQYDIQARLILTQYT